MKRTIKICAILMAVVCALNLTVDAVNVSGAYNAAAAAKVAVQIDQTNNGALNARFTNMLNHNYLYDNDFESDKIIIENSIIPLLQSADDNDEIDQQLVLNFIANLYGRSVDPTAAAYSFLPASSGKFAIIPRGYSILNHTITSIIEDDSGFIVKSTMHIDAHDGQSTEFVETVFVENAESSFGYNIIRSDIINTDSAA